MTKSTLLDIFISETGVFGGGGRVSNFGRSGSEMTQRFDTLRQNRNAKYRMTMQRNVSLIVYCDHGRDYSIIAVF